MTKYWDEHIRKVPRRQREQEPPSNDNIIIGNIEEGKPDYVCPYCNFIIKTRIATDEIYCNNCKSNFIIGDVRKKSKLEVPKSRNSEVFVATTPAPVSPFDKKEPEIKGGFKALRDKGIKIKNYREDIPK